MSDNVNHPAHYQGRFECIDEMIALFGVEAVVTWCKLNVYKYRFRAGAKNGEEDLKKAEWYVAKAAELQGLGIEDHAPSCETCRHRSQNIFKDPCDVCNGYRKYEKGDPEPAPPIKKLLDSCDNCVHGPKGSHQHPCNTCYFLSKHKRKENP